MNNVFAKVPCILCGETSQLGLDLSDLNTIHCESCDSDFNLVDVASLITQWQAVMSWVERAPKYPEAT